MSRQFRPEDPSAKERRLCHLDIMKSAGDFAKDAITLRWAKAGINHIAGVSAMWINGVRDAWMLEATNEEVKDGQLMAIAEFAKTAPPSLQAIIEQLFRDNERPTLTELTVIFSQEKWMQLFSNTNNFLESDLPLTPKATLHNGPEGIFASMDEEHRKLFYYDYVQGIIPLAVRDDPRFAQYFGATGTELDRVENHMLPHAAEINGSMKMILGIKSPPAPHLRATDPSFNIAKDSLMHYYWRDGKRIILSADGTTTIKLPLALGAVEDRDAAGNTVVRGEGLKPQFTQDIEHAVGHNLYMGTVDDIRRRLGPSFLKGALDPAMGVMDADDLPGLQAYIGSRTVDKVAHRLQTQVDVRARTNVLRREQRRNAETLGQTFSNMSGIEKIALVGIVGTLLATSKAARGALGALGVLYFGQKFLLKQKDPANDIWMPMIRGLADKANDFTRPGFKAFGIEIDKQQYGDADIQQRIALMTRFLSERARMELNTSVEGFTILSDMKLSELSSFFQISKDGTVSALRYWDPNFKKLIREKVAKHGLDPSTAEKFFGGAELEDFSDPAIAEEFDNNKLNRHLRESGDGLGTVFYMIAVREPRNKTALRIIESFRSSMGFGSYQDLPMGTHYVEYIDESGERRGEYIENPRELYAHLVREGQLLASGNQISLMDFVASELGANTDSIKLPPPGPPQVGNPANNPAAASNQLPQSANNPAAASNQPAQNPNNPQSASNQPPQSANNPGNAANQPPQTPNNPQSAANQPPQSAANPGNAANQPPQNPNNPGNASNQPPQNPNNPGNASNQPPQSANNPGNASNQPSASANNPSSSANQPSASANKPPNSANQPSGSANSPQSAANQPSASPNTPSSGANQPSTAPNNPSSGANQPQASANNPSSAGNQPSSSPNNSPSASNQPSGSANSPQPGTNQPSASPSTAPSGANQPSASANNAPNAANAGPNTPQNP